MICDSQKRIDTCVIMKLPRKTTFFGRIIQVLCFCVCATEDEPAEDSGTRRNRRPQNTNRGRVSDADSECTSPSENVGTALRVTLTEISQMQTHIFNIHVPPCEKFRPCGHLQIFKRRDVKGTQTDDTLKKETLPNERRQTKIKSPSKHVGTDPRVILTEISTQTDDTLKKETLPNEWRQAKIKSPSEHVGTAPLVILTEISTQTDDTLKKEKLPNERREAKIKALFGDAPPRSGRWRSDTALAPPASIGTLRAWRSCGESLSVPQSPPEWLLELREEILIHHDQHALSRARDELRARGVHVQEPGHLVDTPRGGGMHVEEIIEPIDDFEFMERLLQEEDGSQITFRPYTFKFNQIVRQLRFNAMPTINEEEEDEDSMSVE